MATVRICDRCKKTLPSILSYRIKKIRIMLNTLGRFYDKDFDYELCEKCGRDVLNFIKTPPIKALNEQDGGNENGKE